MGGKKEANGGSLLIKVLEIDVLAAHVILTPL